MLVRQYLLDSQYGQIVSGMGLRTPQSDALRTVHDLLSQLPSPIRELEAGIIVDKCRQLQPEWSFPADYSSLTFALATGVGKTRLIGAIAAYLFRSGESKNFVILAPRDAILRKFEQEVREADDKYIFVDSTLVPQPRVCHRGNLSEFRPERDSDALMLMGPNLFVFSPQLLVADGRIAAPSEFAGVSVKEYLRSCEDLVVFVDESHHISTKERDESMSSWGGALSGLKPKLVFELTATPRAGAAIAYEYGLAQCLRERLYTKAVRMIVDKAATAFDDEEYDRYTIRYAVSRLNEKDKALRGVRERMPGFPAIRPVLLIAAKDTKHADAVGDWITEEFEFAKSEVLVIHSRKKTEEDMVALASIEDPDSPVRVVVQVHVLDEGWDVTNVYVVAPLRNVESYVNARQVMGRGLRLPAGRRIGDDEVDTLDVLAFGQETFNSIFEQAQQEFGSPDKPDGGVQVVTAANNTHTGHPPVKRPEDLRSLRTKVIPMPLATRAAVQIPILDMIPNEPELDVLLKTSGLTGDSSSALDLGTLKTTSVRGDLRIERERFLAITTDEIFKEFVYLSDPLHRDGVTHLVEDVLDAVDQSEMVGIDPVLCSKLVVETLLEKYRRTPPKYNPTQLVDTVEVVPAEANVPLTYSEPFTVGDVWTAGWNRQKHFRLPIAGWSHCTHEIAHFDSRPEFEMAYRLDSMEGVDAWLRNEPGQVVVPTLAGNTKADFVIWLSDGRVLLLEIKGEYLWEHGRSDSWVRARDLKTWIHVARGAGGERLEFVLLLGAAANQMLSVSDIFSNDETADLSV